MPVIINEFEVEVSDDASERAAAAPAPRASAAAAPSPLVDADLEDFRRAREERLADD